MILLALMLQSSSAVPAPQKQANGGQSWSILDPPCGVRDDHGDIVVCADGRNGQSLPLPQEKAPPPGRGANPDLSAKRALELQGTPCAATQGGCQVGFGPPIGLIAGALAKGVRAALAKKPDPGDKSKRVAIPLDDAPAPLPPLRP